MAEKKTQVMEETKPKSEAEQAIQGDASGYIDSYRKQRDGLKQTYEWMKPRLNALQRREWERTINGLEATVQALEAGFAPVMPPKNWASGVLHQYVAPIPEHVREAIDKAEPIFGLSRILIYDPNESHFRRPKNYDPMAVGFCDVADQRLHFLIGLWDIDQDLKFIEGTKPMERANESIDNFQEFITRLGHDQGGAWVNRPRHNHTWKPRTIGIGGTSGGMWIDNNTTSYATAIRDNIGEMNAQKSAYMSATSKSQANWVSRMI